MIAAIKAIVAISIRRGAKYLRLAAPKALANLPEQQAEVFCLRVFNEMSYREIARQTGIHPSTVSVLLHRARLKLRELLSGQASKPDREVPL